MTGLVLASAWLITAYGLGCDAPGPRTKAGTLPVDEFTVAADPLVLPIGSIITIEGLEGERQVHDIGGSVRGRHIDMFMSSCKAADLWGRKRRRVTILHVGGTKAKRGWK